MAQAPSRTPIDPALVHDPAQAALDAARLSEIANLIPKDEVDRLIRETDRRERWESLRNPGAVLLIVAASAVATALEYTMEFIAWMNPRERRQRRQHPQPTKSTERPRVDVVRGLFMATWVQAIDSMLDDADGSPVTLGDDLFPVDFPNDRLHGFRSWRDVLAHQCWQDLDERSVAGLMDAFALRMGEVIRSHGRHEITRTIVIRWVATHYIAIRIPPRAA